jgi:hypothetical protein
MVETALYLAVKRFLEAAGFGVKGEVCGCDIVAVREGDPVHLAIVEMKRGFNLDLLLQAIDGCGRRTRCGWRCRVLGVGATVIRVHESCAG